LSTPGRWFGDLFFSPSASGCPAQHEGCTVRKILFIRVDRVFPEDDQGACVKHPMLSQVPSKTREGFVGSATMILIICSTVR